MTMFMMMIDIASVEIVEKVQVTRIHSTICTMFTKVKTHQNSALIGNILDSFSFYLVIVLSCFHNLHIVKIENQLCLSSDVTVIDWVADVHNGLALILKNIARIANAVQVTPWLSFNYLNRCLCSHWSHCHCINILVSTSVYSCLLVSTSVYKCLLVSISVY